MENGMWTEFWNFPSTKEVYSMKMPFSSQANILQKQQTVQKVNQRKNFPAFPLLSNTKIITSAVVSLHTFII